MVVRSAILPRHPMERAPGVLLPEFRTGRNPRPPARHRARFRKRGDRAAGGPDRCRQRLPAGPVAAPRRTRAARHHGRDRMGRRTDGLSRALHRDGGDLPGVGLGGAVLRRALQPLRQPDQSARHAGTEGALSAEARQRRACRGARDERIRRGFRRRVDASRRAPGGRRLCPERREDVDHQRSRRGHLRDLREDGARGRPARHHGVHRGAGRARVLALAEARQARHARFRHLRTGLPGR